MIRSRNFLYGLGTGLITASLLFGASDLLNSSRSAAEVSVNQTNLTNQKSGGAASDPSPSATQPANPNQSSAPPAAKNQEPAKPPATVKVEITDGMTASQIADLLAKKGVIADPDAFLKAAQDKVKQIRIGSYDLPMKGDYGQILQIITTVQPNNR